MKLKLTGLAISLFLSIACIGQIDSGIEEGQSILVELNDGTRLSGTLIKMSGRSLVIASRTLGEQKIELKDIKRLKPSSGSKDTDFDDDNPFYSKYFLSETAIGLEKGKGYYQNIMIVGNVVSYGFTNNISASFGFETVSLFQGETPGVLFGAKITSNPIGDKLYFGAGANLVTSFGEGYGGSLYAMGTYGDKRNNFTLGVGFGYIDGEIADTPVIQLGGMVSISDRFGLVADNWFVSSGGDLYGFGTFTFRYMTSSVAFDLGAVASYDAGGAFPVLSATIAF